MYEFRCDIIQHGSETPLDPTIKEYTYRFRFFKPRVDEKPHIDYWIEGSFDLFRNINSNHKFFDGDQVFDKISTHPKYRMKSGKITITFDDEDTTVQECNPPPLSSLSFLI